MKSLSESQFNALKTLVSRRLQDCLSLAEQYFQQSFIMPNVSYNLRGVKAGVACLTQNSIRFNRILLLENPHLFIEQTVPHELAHLIVYQKFGKVKPHGKEWQKLMIDVFHLPAEIYHQFNIQNVRRSVAYICDCQIHQLSIYKHNKILRGQGRYICRQCKGWLLPMQ